MNPSIYRAGGHDFANLWMNTAKIVIALVFLYQNALDTQLGVKLFQDYYYVFRVPVSRDGEEGDAATTEVVTPEDPYFSIDFKPLVLGQAYDEFTIEVLKLTNPEGEDLLMPAPAREGPCQSPEPGCVRFVWADLTKGDKAVLHRASFNLLDLVRDESALVSGDYQVQFGFDFFSWWPPAGTTRADCHRLGDSEVSAPGGVTIWRRSRGAGQAFPHSTTHPAAYSRRRILGRLGCLSGGQGSGGRR